MQHLSQEKLGEFLPLHQSGGSSDECSSAGVADVLSRRSAKVAGACRDMHGGSDSARRMRQCGK